MTEHKNMKKENNVAAEDAVQSAETAVVATEAGAGEVKQRKAKGARLVPSGIAFIKATFNNTKVTVTDPRGNVLCWGTAGKAGFKGSRKSTAYAAQQVATDTIKRAQQSFGMREIEARINGPGPGRESAVRGVAAAGIDITSIKDITPVPHNGCRPPKRRRI
jgi:small subunit ribosomal protein S11